MTKPPKPAHLYQHFYGPGIFEPLARHLVPFAGPVPGGRGLDLACGTGIVARELAPRLGDAGAVVAVDRNPAMLEIAREQPAPEGAPIEWREGDALELEPDAEPFDLAVCQQGLQFFGDRVGALRRIRDTLHPAGHVTVAVWQDVGRQSLMAEFVEVEIRHLQPLGVPADDILAPFSFGDEDELGRSLEEAGFDRVEIRLLDFVAELPDPPTVARNLETAYAAVIPTFAERPDAFEDYLDAVERDTRAIVARYDAGDRVRFPMPAILARAAVG